MDDTVTRLIISLFKTDSVQTRIFPGADENSHHGVIMMNFQLRLKKIRRLKNTRLTFDLEKLKYPIVARKFNEIICDRFATFCLVEEDDESVTNQFNTTVTDTSKHHWTTSSEKETLGHRRLAGNVW